MNKADMLITAGLVTIKVFIIASVPLLAIGFLTAILYSQPNLVYLTPIGGLISIFFLSLIVSIIINKAEENAEQKMLEALNNTDKMEKE